jgi:nitric oxide synthase oxygenase domain/subunit
MIVFASSTCSAASTLGWKGRGRDFSVIKFVKARVSGEAVK